ncbi:hypothetical protein [Paraburkholderia sp. BL25I1N1]|uniref:hypothetical protein n=1 Tax=Paraburkholderia sp. BL25I1N1 TaxID=1938804 RepID=UPI000D05D461|nr:hypothetical protein [Paraburkholderia sp. BL25I1N1]PRY03119.1 hypothetical protein B0G73_117169 [Paraburkholderia sp. BL25I1N1]
MSGTFNLSNDALDIGTGPVLAPDCTTVLDLAGAGWKALDAQNGWESFSVDELIIWRRSFAVAARIQEGKLAAIDCIWNDGSIRKEDWSATDELL